MYYFVLLSFVVLRIPQEQESTIAQPNIWLGKICKKYPGFGIQAFLVQHVDVAVAQHFSCLPQDNEQHLRALESVVGTQKWLKLLEKRI